MKKNIALVLFILTSHHIICQDPTSYSTNSSKHAPAHLLNPVYAIEQARNVTMVKQWPEYADTDRYGTLPNCLDTAHLPGLSASVDWTNYESYGIRSNKNLYIAAVHNAYVAPVLLGTVFDHQQQFLFDVTIHPGMPIFWPVNYSAQQLKVQYYKKLATVQGALLYYHWIIDRFPSIFLLRDLLQSDPEIRLLIHGAPNTFGYVRQYLDLVGINPDQCIFTNQRTLYFGETVYFATPFLMEPIPQKLLQAYRNQLVTAAQQKPTSRPYRRNLIAVIQRKEADRNIKNIDEVFTALQTTFAGKDIEIISFDASTSVSEQIMIFNNARVIIGLMASGLSNVIFAQPGTSVIEIHPSCCSLGGTEWVWWLSSAMNLDFWMIPATYQLSDRLVNCPMEEFKKVIAQIVGKF